MLTKLNSIYLIMFSLRILFFHSLEKLMQTWERVQESLQECYEGKSKVGILSLSFSSFFSFSFTDKIHNFYHSII